MRIESGDFDASLIGDLDSRAPQVKTENRATCCHRLHANPAAGVVEAGVDENVAIGKFFEGGSAGESAQKLDL